MTQDPEDPDGKQTSDDAMRYAVIRKIYTVMGFPRRCREASCRRAQRCVGRTMRCGRDNPAPPMTPEQKDAALAQWQKLLKARVEEIEAAQAAAEFAAAGSLSAPARARGRASPGRPASRRRGTRS